MINKYKYQFIIYDANTLNGDYYIYDKYIYIQI